VTFISSINTGKLTQFWLLPESGFNTYAKRYLKCTMIQLNFLNKYGIINKSVTAAQLYLFFKNYFTSMPLLKSYIFK